MDVGRCRKFWVTNDLTFDRNNIFDAGKDNQNYIQVAFVRIVCTNRQLQNCEYQSGGKCIDFPSQKARSGMPRLILADFLLIHI